MEQSLTQPSNLQTPEMVMPPQKSKLFLVLLFLVCALLFSVVLVFAYERFIVPQRKPMASPALITSPPPSIQAESAIPNDWKTYTNNTYGYSLKYPSDFKISFCNDCRPPEVSVNFQNKGNIISFSINYAFQGSLCANNTLPCLPVHNFKPVITGQTYAPQEYYSQDVKQYLFGIDEIKNGSKPTQLGITGRYSTTTDTAVISQILSTFKFTD